MDVGPKHNQLTAFLRELPAVARGRLAAALEGMGENDPLRSLIAGPLQAARRQLGELPPEVDADRELMAALDPFVVPEETKAKILGVVSQAGRDRLFAWLKRDDAKDIFENLRSKVATLTTAEDVSNAVESAQGELARRLDDILQKAGSDRDRGRLSLQIGGDNGAADLLDFAVVLKHRKIIHKIASGLQAGGPVGEILLAAKSTIDPVATKTPEALPAALTLFRSRVTSPQIFVRFAAYAADSQDFMRIKETPYSLVLDIALGEAERALWRARKFGSTADRPLFLTAVKNFGATARALSSEIEMPQECSHAKRLSALRKEMAETIRGDLQHIGPRIRSLVRPRGSEALAIPDSYEMSRLEADIDLLVITRTFAEETALNALSSRAYSDAREILDTGPSLLIERMRGADPDAKAALKARLSAIVNVAAKIFNADYAAQLQKAVEVASQESRNANQLRSA